MADSVGGKVSQATRVMRLAAGWPRPHLAALTDETGSLRSGPP